MKLYVLLITLCSLTPYHEYAAEQSQTDALTPIYNAAATEQLKVLNSKINDINY